MEEKDIYKGMKEDDLIEIILNFKNSTIYLLGENSNLKSSQNKLAIEKLEELFDILNENITDFTDVGKSKYCWLCIEEFNKNFNSIIAELKGGNDE